MRSVICESRVIPINLMELNGESHDTDNLKVKAPTENLYESQASA